MKQNKLWMMAPALLAVMLIAPSCNKNNDPVDPTIPITLENSSWATIKDISKLGRARDFFSLGETKTLLVNGVTHIVKIIGFNQDVDKDGNKIGITFEFDTLLSDQDGYSLATYWNDSDDTLFANEDYKDSTLRAVLNGNDYKGSSTADIHWFIKDSKTYSTTYKTSVLDMLPVELTNVLTAPVKYINIGGAEDTVCDKLFLLSPKEMGYDDPEGYQEESTIAYTYYEGHDKQVDEIRIKHQVKGAEGALTHPTSGIEGKFRSSNKQSYAGLDMYNEEYEQYYGGDYYLRSPDKNRFTNVAWKIDHSGMASNYGGIFGGCVNDTAYAIAPAFCI